MRMVLAGALSPVRGGSAGATVAEIPVGIVLAAQPVFREPAARGYAPEGNVAVMAVEVYADQAATMTISAFRGYVSCGTLAVRGLPVETVAAFQVRSVGTASVVSPIAEQLSAVMTAAAVLAVNVNAAPSAWMVGV